MNPYWKIQRPVILGEIFYLRNSEDGMDQRGGNLRFGNSELFQTAGFCWKNFEIKIVNKPFILPNFQPLAFLSV
jgi:hypothetical protein